MSCNRRLTSHSDRHHRFDAASCISWNLKSFDMAIVSLEKRRDRHPLLSLGALEPTMACISPIWRSEHRRNSLICHINIIGLLSVFLVLFSIFIVQGPHGSFFSRPYVAVDLAKVSAPVPMRSADREDAMTIAVRKMAKSSSRNIGVTSMICRVRFKSRSTVVRSARFTSEPTLAQDTVQSKKS